MKRRKITDFIAKSYVHDMSKSSYTQAYKANKAMTKLLNIKKLRPYQ